MYKVHAQPYASYITFKMKEKYMLCLIVYEYTHDENMCEYNTGG